MTTTFLIYTMVLPTAPTTTTTTSNYFQQLSLSGLHILTWSQIFLCDQKTYCSYTESFQFLLSILLSWTVKGAGRALTEGLDQLSECFGGIQEWSLVSRAGDVVRAELMWQVNWSSAKTIIYTSHLTVSTDHASAQSARKGEIEDENWIIIQFTLLVIMWADKREKKSINESQSGDINATIIPLSVIWWWYYTVAGCL